MSTKAFLDFLIQTMDDYEILLVANDIAKKKPNTPLHKTFLKYADSDKKGDFDMAVCYGVRIIRDR